MNPENHVVVKFLRFLQFNEAADMFVESLLNPNVVISFHSNVDAAVTELLERNNQLHLDSFFASKQADLFKEIAEKYHLHQLSSLLANNAEPSISNAILI